jgi:hypothetical protein
MILGYFGLEMKNLKSGELQQSTKSTQSYDKVFEENLWKVVPILASLNILGFRRYAIQLVKFLDLKIYGNEGFYQEHLADLDSDSKTEFHNKNEKPPNVPLSELIEEDDMNNIWFFGELKETNQNLLKNELKLEKFSELD